MNLLNISPFSQYVVRGVILLAAVIFDRYKQKAKRAAVSAGGTDIWLSTLFPPYHGQPKLVVNYM